MIPIPTGETKSEVDAGQNSFLKVSEAAFLFD
jgi:hypothetical protein